MSRKRGISRELEVVAEVDKPSDGDTGAKSEERIDSVVGVENVDSDSDTSVADDTTNVQSYSKISTFSDDEDEAALEELVFGYKKRKKAEHKEEDKVGGFFIDKTAGACEKSAAVWEDDDDEEGGSDKEEEEEAKPRGFGSMRFQPLAKTNRKAEFEKVFGEPPSWSVLPDIRSDEKDNELLTTSFKYTTESERLPSSVLDFHKCPNANRQQPSHGALEACEFHKTAQIALTAGADCRLNLFQIDGKTNPKIHSFFTERFPIKCAHFLASGKEIVMTSNRNYFYSYDLISGKVIKIPYIKGINDRKLRKFFVSPDNKHLIFISRYGRMHIVSASTKELVKSVQMNGMVSDIAFRNGGQQFAAFGEEGTVALWDIRSYGCVHSFADEGSTFGNSVAVSPNDQYIACGSRNGIVNLYDESCLRNVNPVPIKTFKNLQYSIYGLHFNATSEILGVTSAEDNNAVKLIHVPSLTVFPNFPGFKVHYLKMVRVIDFSPNSGYMMLGNQRGEAFMFRLDHYKSY